MRLITLSILLALTAIFSNLSGAAVWQWHVPSPRGAAFLWVPENCAKLRGVLVASQVILEKTAIEDPVIREAAARNSLAIVALNRAKEISYSPTPEELKNLSGLLKKLGEISGYTELATLPRITLGHSGGAIFAWYCAYGDPDNTIAVIALKAAPIPPPAYAPKSTVDGVPLLDISGQYESWDGKHDAEHHVRWVRGHLLADRGFRDRALMSMVVEPGATHFGWTPALADYVAKFIDAACAIRLDSDGKVLDVPLEKGFLADCVLIRPARHQAAAYRDYTGEKSLAFWHPSLELAKISETFSLPAKSKLPQELSWVEDGKQLPKEWLNTLKFRPEADGKTVRVKAESRTHASPEIDPQKSPIGHSGKPVKYKLIGGWMGGGKQVGDDLFRMQRDNFSYRRGYDNMMIMAYREGDEKYNYTEQPMQVKFPSALRDGEKQTITFELPEKVNPGKTAKIRLEGKSSSGLPVEYFVLSGPAMINEQNELIFTPVPPRAKYPLPVTVVAHQYGIPGKFSSAPDVERTLYLVKE